MLTGAILLTMFAAAAALVVVVVGTSREQAGRPTLPDVARAARDEAEVAGIRALDLRVDGLGFPDWRARAWHVVGGRHDELADARPAATVAYRNGDRTITYTIIGGEEAGTLAPDGRMCLVEADDAEDLLALASVREGRTVVMTGAPADDEMARTMRRLAVGGL